MGNIIELKQSDGTKAYPITPAEAVYMADGSTAEIEITELKNDIDRGLRAAVDITDGYINNKYIDLLLAVGATVDITPVDDTAFAYQIVPVYAGDTLVITGGGGNRQRLYALTDTNYKLILKSDSQYTTTNESVNVTVDGYFISNVRYKSNHSLVLNKIVDVNSVVEAAVNDAIGQYMCDQDDPWEV